MKTTTFTELRNNANKYFDAVEGGESLEIYRHGKLIAVISPATAQSLARWKTYKPIKINGAELSKAILDERSGK